MRLLRGDTIEGTGDTRDPMSILAPEGDEANQLLIYLNHRLVLLRNRRLSPIPNEEFDTQMFLKFSDSIHWNHWCSADEARWSEVTLMTLPAASFYL